jgi:DNA-binding NarL/FixJ family response regulator
MGFTNQEIANKLLLAESTVKSHLTSIFSKLGVRGRSEAAALVLDPTSGLGTGVLAILDGAR